MAILTQQQHRTIAYWGMVMIALGLPLSVFLMSIGMFVLAGNWLLEGQYRKRLGLFFADPVAMSIISLYLFYCIGMLWTDDLAMGLHELKIKLPLLLLPLFLFTSKLPDRERIDEVLKLFVVACLTGMLIGMAHYFELTGQELLNKRQLSAFISHIRFGLMLVFSFFLLGYLLYSRWNKWSVTEKGAAMASMAWILWFIVVLESFTAYAAFTAVSLVTVLRLPSARVPARIKAIILSVGALFLVASSIYTLREARIHFHEVPFDYRTQVVRTLNGNLYAHQKDVLYRENGHRVWSYVCWEELKKEWPQRSKADLEGTDKKGQPLKYTAIRYMTSKGLLKDSAGVWSLTAEDIANIENGHTNYRHTEKLGVAQRIDELLWAIEQYTWKHDANNSSAVQRYVYLKVGLDILRENPLFGVGTGDVAASYREAYRSDPRGLKEEFQGISHIQFLTVGIALGWVGLLVFLFSLLFPLWHYRKDHLYVCFFALIMVSFLTDNTLSRQSGVMLYAFFNALLIVRHELSTVDH